ncbi:MAG: hypothetical protein FWD17_15500, partial [Polyangiaceae bacterium]|nr:hypothetical protein [Polyangiaceae bacterium]
MTGPRRAEDHSSPGDAIGALHERALARSPSDDDAGAERFMDWFDREVSPSRAELSDRAVRASPTFGAEAPLWRRGGLRAVTLALCGVALVFGVGRAISGYPSPPPVTRVDPTADEAPPPTGLAFGDPCRQAVRAAGSAPLVDDFEDGNELVALLESRNGYWVVVTDDDPPATETVLQPSLLPVAGPANRSALHLAGGRHTKWGASAQLEIGPTCYDASVYRGIAFDARGPGRLYAGVRTVDAVPV